MTEERAARPLAAAGLVVSAMALIGFIDTLVVRVAEIAGLWQFHLLRALMALPLIWVVARVAKLRIRPRRPAAVALRSLALSVAMVLYFGALGFMPVGQAAAGLFTAPIFVLLISVAVFGMRAGWRRALAVALGFAGVLLVLGPGAERISAATAMPLGAALFYAMAALATRRFCAREPTLALLLGFFLAMLVWGVLGLAALALWQPAVPEGSAGFLLRGWQPLSAELLFWVAVQAVGSVVGIGMLTRAYLIGEAPDVAAFEYTLLVFAAGWGWLLFGQVLGPAAWAGIALIAAAGVVLARRGGYGSPP